MKIRIFLLTTLLAASTIQGAANGTDSAAQGTANGPPYAPFTSVEQLDKRVAQLIHKYPAIRAFDMKARAVNEGVGDYYLYAFLTNIASGRNYSPELTEANMVAYVRRFNEILERKPLIKRYLEGLGNLKEPAPKDFWMALSVIASNFMQGPKQRLSKKELKAKERRVDEHAQIQIMIFPKDFPVVQ